MRERKLILSMMLIFMGVVMVSAKDFGTLTKAGPELSAFESNNMLRVVYDGNQPVNLKVKIMNDDGYLLFVEHLHKEGGFIRPYDLSELEKGTYRVYVSDGAQELSREFSIGPPLTREPEIVSHVTRLEGNGRKYLLSVPDQGLEKIRVQIYNDNRTEVFNRVMDASKGYAVVFNIKGLVLTDELTMEVSDQSSASSAFAKVLYAF